jgi:hypothetical protein
LHISYITRNPENRGLKRYGFVFTRDDRLDPMPYHLRG